MSKTTKIIDKYLNDLTEKLYRLNSKLEYEDAYNATKHELVKLLGLAENNWEDTNGH